MWGRISEEQTPVIARHVAGRHVHDLGAGNRTLSVELLRLGARHVVAVDHEPYADAPVHPDLTVIQAPFRTFREEIDVAFVSWPSPHPTALHRLVSKAPLVLYLGKCTDGSFCGYPAFWQALSQRELLDRVYDRANVLLVYGPRIVPRFLEPEEQAGMDLGRPYYYDELYKPGPSSLSNGQFTQRLEAEPDR